MPPKLSHIALTLSSLIPIGWLGLHAATTDAAKHQFTDQQRKYWAFQKIKRPEVPEVRDNGRVANAVDAFILAKLEAASVKPNPPADRVTLLRRVTFDL